jgi:hypothetical protein
MSLAALIAHIVGLLDMAFFLAAIGLPSIVLLVAAAAYARIVDAGVFVHQLALGVAAGLVATLAYDVSRFLIQLTNVFDYNAFYAISVFGSWIANEPRSSAAALTAGWIYHFWNGVSFGVMFALTFGRPRWWWGVAYGLVMETLMLGIFPTFLDIGDRAGFVAISLAGHAVYGAVLGAACQRHGRDWLAPRAA